MSDGELENEKVKMVRRKDMNNKVTDRQRDRFPDGRVQGQVVPEFADPGSGKSVLNALEKRRNKLDRFTSSASEAVLGG